MAALVELGQDDLIRPRHRGATRLQPHRLQQVYPRSMTSETQALKLGAQEMLDELFVQTLIPFRLSACTVESLGMEEYIIRFNDSRLHSVDLSWKSGQSFKSVFRAAVLGRITRLGSIA